MRSILALSLMMVAAPALAQQQDRQVWLQVNTNVPLTDRVRLTLEQIARFGERTDGLFQTEVGGILGFKLSRNWEAGFGYRRVGAHNANRADDEDRLRQHLVGTFGPVLVRFRLDERFNPRGDEIGYRFRPLVRYTRKLGRQGFALFASHESFYLPNDTAWGQRAGYERMRNIVGVVLPIAKGLSGDLGYLNQYRFGRAGARDQMDHALNFQLTINLAPVRHDGDGGD